MGKKMIFRKILLKTIAIFMAVCMVVSLGGIASSESERRVPGFKTEIVFEDDVCREKAELITAVINGEESASPRSIVCLFAGHTTTTTTVYATTHNYYTTSPKCREQIYRIIYCTRSGCSYNTGSIIADLRIHCC
ncbi:MAG: hypothetical protein FWH07_03665 [Oscillospiraceae bacterium]|nr:hypothetical protein [Oscillospiraceae bacterium]